VEAWLLLPRFQRMSWRAHGSWQKRGVGITSEPILGQCPADTCVAAIPKSQNCKGRLVCSNHWHWAPNDDSFSVVYT
jgi:hypothetical protein